jgi:DNA-binding TFAR19-related protein (PDSD5 family)
VNVILESPARLRLESALAVARPDSLQPVTTYYVYHVRDHNSLAPSCAQESSFIYSSRHSIVHVILESPARLRLESALAVARPDSLQPDTTYHVYHLRDHDSPAPSLRARIHRSFISAGTRWCMSCSSPLRRVCARSLRPLSPGQPRCGQTLLIMYLYHCVIMTRLTPSCARESSFTYSCGHSIVHVIFESPAACLRSESTPAVARPASLRPDLTHYVSISLRDYDSPDAFVRTRIFLHL